MNLVESRTMQDELDPLIEKLPHDDDGGTKNEVAVLVRSPLCHENQPRLQNGCHSTLAHNMLRKLELEAEPQGH